MGALSLRLLCLVALLGGMVGCAAVAMLPPPLVPVKEVTYQEGTVAVELAGGGWFTVRQHQWGNRVILDLAPCVVSKPGRVGVDDDQVAEYHWAQNDPQTVRLVVTVQAETRVRVRRLRNYVVVAVAARPRARPREPERPIMVLIDPGHGGTDAGGVGRFGTLEKDVTLDISRRLAARLLADRRFDVRMTRIDDSGPSLVARRDMSRALQPNLMISVHLNASRDRQKSKTEVYFYSERSRELARHVGLALMNALQTDELVYGGRLFYVLRFNGAAYSILVEPLYLSNAAHERFLASGAGRERVARVLYEAIASYFRDKPGRR
jgi:N-acetylmuramoyl-L-alanine amidase